MNWLNDVLQNDPDPTETREWVESLKAVIDVGGPERAHQLLENMVELTRRAYRARLAAALAQEADFRALRPRPADELADDLRTASAAEG